MKTAFLLKVQMLSLFLCLIASPVFSLDYPHTTVNNISCDSCHFVYGSESSLMIEGLSYGQNIDDTQYNALCWSCHNDIAAPYQRTHSSLQIDDSYGDWTVECRVCHNPHSQRQFRQFDAILYEGEVLTVTATELQKTNDGTDWETDEYAGLVAIPDSVGSDKKYGYKIVGNTADTITVEGPINLSKVDPGNTFAIIYGKLVKDVIELDEIMGTDPLKEGDKTVKFFKPTGTNSFADGDIDLDGVCEACHTKTTHFRNDGLGGEQYHENLGGKQGTDCIDCHSHSNGFGHGGAGGGGGDGSGCSSSVGCHQDQDSHPTHLSGNLGNVTCLTCHYEDNFPRFADDQDKAGTTVCVNCHSANGLALAKQYWENPGSSLRTPGSWAVEEGEKSFCGSCHDTTPGNSKGDGLGDNAFNVLGDDLTYGFYVTGHGKESGNYAALSWQDVSADGNAAANMASCAQCHGIPPVPPGPGEPRVTPCSFCHDLSSLHFDNSGKRLRAGFENDQDNTVCSKCHPPGTSALSLPEFYTNSDEYELSAHKDRLCTECHDVHGAAGPYKGMTKAEHEALCFQCHKDHLDGGIKNDALANNRPGDYVSSDDIQEAFGKSEKHDLSTEFSIGSGNYVLECVSCHNVHVVTGKYWEAEEGKTPITRFTDNTEPWGDDPGEKMDDFAARGSGTGGWYYNIAKGYPLGTTGLSFDQPAVYQPPKAGGGYEFEFEGDVLPDYTTFCLDCHSDRVSAASPAVNWGQGISCTDNSVDPPDQRIECGAPHGLNAANKPAYVSDEGTAGFWGTSGNPDMIFSMNYVTRGRHNGHFMRWPYDSADRSAGINFVLSCTDCHEAHGADRGSMIRERLNVNAYGDCGSGGDTDPNGESCADGSNWNEFCNICHYYYGGHHAGMSCGNASCHETNSIHRIIHSGGGGGVQLMLTAAGYEEDFERPDFTPEMVSVVGHIGSNDLTVTFDDGVWSNMDLSGSIDNGDFWLFDNGNNNPRTIQNVTHTSGSSTATITMSAPLVESDLSLDTLAIKPASIWNWYVGGYNNAANGVVPAQAVSGGPWPVPITGPPIFNILGVLYGGIQLPLDGIISDSNQIYVTFTEGAYSIISDDLQIGAFVLDCGGRTISSVTHTAGDSFAVLTLDSIVDQSEIGVCTVAAAPDSIFDFYGNAAGTATVTLALPLEAAVDDLVLNWNFNEGLGTVANSSGALGTQEDMHGVLTRNVQWAASTKPGAAAGDNAVNLDRVSDRGAVQLNYTINPDDGFPPATYNTGGASVLVQEMQKTSEFSFSVWIKPTALGCTEGQTLGLNTKLRRDILTTQFWIKNWALGIMRFSDDGNPLTGNCTDEDSTHDVLRFWVAVGDPNDMRCDPWGGSWPETVYPVSPSGYIQGTYLQPTDQAVCDSSATPTLPTNPKAHTFAQTETSASGALTYGVALQPGVWQHVVGTWDGRYIRIYIDAQLAAETDMGGTGNYIMLDDQHLWGGDLIGDASLSRHVSSGFGVGARPIFSSSGAPSNGAVYWNTNGFYDLNNATYVGELDDVKYWKSALPLSTIQY